MFVSIQENNLPGTSSCVKSHSMKIVNIVFLNQAEHLRLFTAFRVT